MQTIRLYGGVTAGMFSSVPVDGFAEVFADREVVDRNESGSLVAVVCSDGKRRVVSVYVPRKLELLDVEGNAIERTGLLDDSAWSYFSLICGSDNKDADLLVAAKSVKVEITGKNPVGVFARDCRRVTKTFFSGKTFTHSELVSGYGEGYVVEKMERV